MNRQEYLEIKNRAWNWYKNGMRSWSLATKVNEIVEKMKKGDFVLYSPLVGVEEIKPTAYYYQTYNCEHSLAIECKDFGKSNFKILEIANSEDIYLRCLDNSEMDEAYQELVLNFKNGLGEQKC